MTEGGGPVKNKRNGNRLFKNPPQPYMCIQDYLQGSEIPCYINVLSWHKVAMPPDIEDGLTLFGGMRLSPPRGENPEINIFAVMINPIPLKLYGKNTENIKVHTRFMAAILDFVEAQNNGVHFSRKFTILKNQDIIGELKEVWMAVQETLKRRESLGNQAETLIDAQTPAIQCPQYYQQEQQATTQQEEEQQKQVIQEHQREQTFIRSPIQQQRIDYVQPPEYRSRSKYSITAIETMDQDWSYQVNNYQPASTSPSALNQNDQTDSTRSVVMQSHNICLPLSNRYSKIERDTKRITPTQITCSSYSAPHYQFQQLPRAIISHYANPNINVNPNLNYKMSPNDSYKINMNCKPEYQDFIISNQREITQDDQHQLRQQVNNESQNEEKLMNNRQDNTNNQRDRQPIINHQQSTSQHITHPHQFQQSIVHPHQFQQPVAHPSHHLTQTIPHPHHHLPQSIPHPHQFQQPITHPYPLPQITHSHQFQQQPILHSHQSPPQQATAHPHHPSQQQITLSQSLCQSFQQQTLNEKKSGMMNNQTQNTLNRRRHHHHHHHHHQHHQYQNSKQVYSNKESAKSVIKAENPVKVLQRDNGSREKQVTQTATTLDKDISIDEKQRHIEEDQSLKNSQITDLDEDTRTKDTNSTVDESAELTSITNQQTVRIKKIYPKTGRKKKSTDTKPESDNMQNSDSDDVSKQELNAEDEEIIKKVIRKKKMESKRSQSTVNSIIKSVFKMNTGGNNGDETGDKRKAISAVENFSRAIRAARKEALHGFHNNQSYTILKKPETSTVSGELNDAMSSGFDKEFDKILQISNEDRNDTTQVNALS